MMVQLLWRLLSSSLFPLPSLCFSSLKLGWTHESFPFLSVFFFSYHPNQGSISSLSICDSLASTYTLNLLCKFLYKGEKAQTWNLWSLRFEPWLRWGEVGLVLLMGTSVTYWFPSCTLIMSHFYLLWQGVSFCLPYFFEVEVKQEEPVSLSLQYFKALCISVWFWDKAERVLWGKIVQGSLSPVRFCRAAVWNPSYSVCCQNTGCNINAAIFLALGYITEQVVAVGQLNLTWTIAQTPSSMSLLLSKTP